MDTDSARGVSWRAVLIGILLVGFMSVVSPWAVLMVKGSQLTTNAVPILAVFLFFFVTAVFAPLLKTLRPSLSLSRGELITIYAMMLTGSVVVTNGFTGSFLSIISGLFYYATPTNNWEYTIIPHVHPWLVPTSREAVRLLYEGLPVGVAIPWSAWVLPLCSWGFFILVFYWVILCLGVMLRGQWVERERLVFPLTQLPLAMMEEADPGRKRTARIFGNSLLWLGFLLPLLIHSWNSLGNYHSEFQKIALTGSVAFLNGEMAMSFRLNFPALGLGYLMPLNVSFSVWFFYLLGVIQKFLILRVGGDIGSPDIWTPGNYPTAMMHEQAGALVVLVLFVLWTGRGHLHRFFVQAWQGQARRGEEILSPRVAVCGQLVGGILMVTWLVLTGLDLYVALLLVIGALVVFIGLSRIVGEAGFPGCQTPMVPQAFVIRGFGPETLGLQNMTGLGFSTVWIGETATNMMNAVVHSLKLTSTEGRLFRRLPWAILLAVLVGLAGSIWITMTLAYSYGGINLHSWYYVGAPKWPFDYITSVANNPESSFVPRLTFTALGGGVMALLMFLRQRLVWWPLNPIAFPVSATYLINYHWFAIFLAWVFKGVILKYAGVKGYRFMLPFFMGLILGEFFTASLWVFIDGWFGMEGNMIFNF